MGRAETRAIVRFSPIDGPAAGRVSFRPPSGRSPGTLPNAVALGLGANPPAVHRGSRAPATSEESRTHKRGRSQAARRTRFLSTVREGARDEMHCAILWRRPCQPGMHCVFSWPGPGRMSSGSAKLNQSPTARRSGRALGPPIVRFNAIDCVRAWPPPGGNALHCVSAWRWLPGARFRAFLTGGGGRNALDSGNRYSGRDLAR